MAGNELKNPYIEVTGMVLSWQPMGEYDRRVVLLTREAGKISAFAKGARRPGSSLVAATDIFAFGTFRLYAGRNSYTIREASISNYFAYFRTHLDSALIGQYFLEVMEYCTRENNDEAALLLLLYQSLRALASPAYADRLVASIFEIRTVTMEGELPEQFQPDHLRQEQRPAKKAAESEDVQKLEQPMQPGRPVPPALSSAVIQAMQIITTAPVSRLFTFRLDEPATMQLAAIARYCMNCCFDYHHFRSLDVLQAMGILQ